ncbi:siderophore-interacting protein [Labrys monachus]|uniref:NADPH-dependent ferric siderophore reductase n=1 Tax=Labrys monachus TaxID=217067 RepID=A0ABU0FGK5_9HYPH|nr:siderophore-interacting protein [Labrys monachus]MDQ0393586.1 NADPH-dependent ferric siderophore reductase [Labrys monachus]
MPAIAEPLPATVRAVQDIAPDMRRVSLGGAGLEALLPAPGALGPYLKLHLEDAEGYSCIRTYSIRRLDLERGELQVDITLHGQDSVGSRFALHAREGDNVGVRGPGVIPAAPCVSYLFAGDLTALPAIAYTLETLPHDVEVDVIVETPNHTAQCLLPCTRGERLRCLHRPAGTPSRLAEAVRNALPQPRGDVFVWAGAEAAIARGIRKHVRTTLGLPALNYQILNYWKAGRAEGDFDCLT